ncbi:MAG: hypothetical protein LBT32_05565 [Peptococcaceae bacterium]|nr:hypothetical protein [Peptococcaceae bacterium]
MRKTITQNHIFHITDQSTEQAFYGCMQQWYGTEFKRRAGCGPSVASNLALYLFETRSPGLLGSDVRSTAGCVRLMDEMWEYVTPKIGGVSTTKRFYAGLADFMKHKGAPASYEYCNVPVQKAKRPGLAQVLSFVVAALDKDTPVAFLNLCNGAEKELDQWHWVTVIALDLQDDQNNAQIEFMDEGRIAKIDLVSWYRTTSLGGGFVYFTL